VVAITVNATGAVGTFESAAEMGTPIAGKGEERKQDVDLAERLPGGDVGDLHGADRRGRRAVGQRLGVEPVPVQPQRHEQHDAADPADPVGGPDARELHAAFAAVIVLRSSIAIVIGPTPPGTGVMSRARSLAPANSTSPFRPRRCG
jgi:hypothetical protein